MYKSWSDYMIYIQSEDSVYPMSDWGMSAWLGFRETTDYIRLFTDIQKVPKAKDIILVASVENTNSYLKSMGITIRPMNLPADLLGAANWKFYQRNYEYMTLGEFFEDTKVPIFVKPAAVGKQFVAGVITKQINKKFFLNDLPLDTEVLVSDIIDIVSEYRCYVLEGKLQGIYNYSGDFRIFPDVKTIDAMIAEMNWEANVNPVAYALDVAVIRNGDTVLVECNDATSLGNYGLPNNIYARMLAKRWREILRRKY